VATLKRRIQELEEELSKRANESALVDQRKGAIDNAEYITLTKELRKLRGVEQRNIQLQQENEKYWGEISKKDKEIIELRAQIRIGEENQDSIDKVKQEKKTLQDKVKKLER
jgi:hypothetical protein